jgi:hypothetical protein
MQPVVRGNTAFSDVSTDQKVQTPDEIASVAHLHRQPQQIAGAGEPLAQVRRSKRFALTSKKWIGSDPRELRW